MSKAASLRRHREFRSSTEPCPTIAKAKTAKAKTGRFVNTGVRAPRPKFVPAEDLEQAGCEYREDLLYHWTAGALTNKAICTTAWKHTRSGGTGTSDLGVNPSSKGGNHARATRRALGLDVVQ